MKKTNVASGAGFMILALAGLLVSAAPAEGRTDESIRWVEGEVQGPVRLVGTDPAYPEEARKERIQGKVVLLSVIDRDGQVSSVDVVEEKSIDRQDLRQAAIDAVEGWTFQPATLEGEAVAVYYHLTINFRLSKDGNPKAAKRDE